MKRRCTQELSYDLWLSSEKKGSYTTLSSGFAATLAALGEEPLSLGDGDVADEVEVEGPYRSPLMYYDFIELYLWPHRWTFRRRITTTWLMSGFWSGSWRWSGVAASRP